MERHQALCRDHGLSFPFDVQAVQALIDALVAFDPSRGGADSVVENEKVCEVGIYKLEETLKLSESKLSDAQKGMFQLELVKGTADQLPTKFNEAESTLDVS